MAREANWPELWRLSKANPNAGLLTGEQRLLLAKWAGSESEFRTELQQRLAPRALTPNAAEIEIRLALAVSEMERAEKLLPAVRPETQLGMLVATNRFDYALRRLGVGTSAADKVDWMRERIERIENHLEVLRQKFEHEAYQSLRTDIRIALSVAQLHVQLGQHEVGRLLFADLASIFTTFDARVLWARRQFMLGVGDLHDSAFYWEMAGRLYRDGELSLAISELFGPSAALARQWDAILEKMQLGRAELDIADRLKSLSCVVQSSQAPDQLPSLLRQFSVGDNRLDTESERELLDIRALADAAAAMNMKFSSPVVGIRLLAIAQTLEQHGFPERAVYYAERAAESGNSTADNWLANLQLSRDDGGAALSYLSRSVASGNSKASILQNYCRAWADDADPREQLDALQRARLQVLAGRIDREFFEQLRTWKRGDEVRRLAEFRLATDDALSYLAESQLMAEELIGELHGEQDLRRRWQERMLFRSLQRKPVGDVVKLFRLGQAAEVRAIRTLVRSGMIDEAWERAQQNLDTHPGHVAMLESLYDLLIDQGYEREAEALASRVIKQLRAMLDAYPNCALHKNNLAWALVSCKQDVDQARELAEQAVTADPSNPAYLDTWAECCFVQGDRSEAILLAKKVLELEPANSRYQQQLAKYSNSEH